MRILIIVLAFVLTSCEKENSIELYVFDTGADDVVITGNNLKYFFVKNDNMRIIKKTIPISSGLSKGFNNVKSNILQKGHIDNLGAGLYYYAIIHRNDTLYSSTGFKTWKCKNKTILYDSKVIKDELSKYINN